MVTPEGASYAVKVPYFLVALPQMQDPLFRRAVVLVASHDSDGAFGLILNKSLLDEDDGNAAVMKAEIKDPDGKVLYEFNEDLFEGGPVHEESVFVLHDNPDEGIANPQIGEEKVFVSSDPNVFQQILSDPQTKTAFRFFLGCSSWSAGQLDAEIRSGAWVSINYDKQFLFTRKPSANVEERRQWQDALWRRVLFSSGLDQLTLIPQGSGGDAGAN